MSTLSMYKKAGTLEGILLGLIIVGVALYFLTSGIVPKILELVKLSPGIDKSESNTLNKEESTTNPKKEISGQLKPLIVKMEETAYPIRPTSKDHCLVGTNLKNTGSTSWEESDKIRIVLYCKYQANEKQITNILPVQNYPPSGYLTGLKPGEEIAVTFPSRAPNNCLKSLDENKIVLYSNCQGNGNNLQPCDYMENAKIISEVKFKCTIG